MLLLPIIFAKEKRERSGGCMGQQQKCHLYSLGKKTPEVQRCSWRTGVELEMVRN